MAPLQPVPDTSNASAKSSTVKAPYPDQTLHAPLTGGQRNNILKYLEKNGYTASTVYGYVTDVAGSFNAQPATDNAWIDLYNTVVEGGGFSQGKGETKTTHQIPGISSTLDFLKDAWGTLTNPGLWLRIGEGILGIVLIAVGLSKLTGIEPPVIKALT